MVLMVARKRMTYRTRRLKAGDVFEMPERDARLFLAIKLVSPVPAELPGTITPPPPPVPACPPPMSETSLSPKLETSTDPETATEPETLQARYERLSGKRPDGRWRESRLIEEIAALEVISNAEGD